MPETKLTDKTLELLAFMCAMDGRYSPVESTARLVGRNATKARTTMSESLNDRLSYLRHYLDPNVRAIAKDVKVYVAELEAENNTLRGAYSIAGKYECKGCNVSLSLTAAFRHRDGCPIEAADKLLTGRK